MAMGEGGSQISFSFALISFFFSFSEIQSPSPGPRRAAAQPRATLHGLNPDQLQAPLELHTEREEKRKKVCANVKERERETLDDRQSFSGGIHHSKTQQREVEY